MADNVTRGVKGDSCPMLPTTTSGDASHPSPLVKGVKGVKGAPGPGPGPSPTPEPEVAIDKEVAKLSPSTATTAKDPQTLDGTPIDHVKSADPKSSVKAASTDSPPTAPQKSDESAAKQDGTQKDKDIKDMGSKSKEDSQDQGKHVYKDIATPDLPSTPISKTPLKTEEVHKMTMEEWEKQQKSVASITADQWYTVFQNNGLLRGIHSSLSATEAMVFAGKVFNMPSMPAYTTPLTFDLTFKDVKSSSFEASVKQGFNQKEIEAAVGATFEAFSVGAKVSGGSSKLDTSQTSRSEEEHTLIALYDIPLAKVSLTPYELELSLECKADVEAILAKPSYTLVEKFNNRFGTLFVTDAEVGGRLFTSDQFKSSELQSKSQLEEKMHMSFQSSFAIPLVSSGSAKVSGENQDMAKSTAATSQAGTSRNWHAVGGLYEARTNPKLWERSLNDPRYWAAIQRSGIRKVTSLISIYPGFSRFESIMDAVLQEGRPAPLILQTLAYCLPNTLELFSSEAGATMQASLRGVDLGRGYDAITGRLCSSFASVLTPFRKKLAASTTYLVLADVPSLTEEISAALHSDETIPINFEYVPVYLGKLKVRVPYIADRFSVVFKWQSDGTKTMFHPALPSDPNVLAETTIKADPRTFYQQYGSHYVAEVDERSTLTAIWTFECSDIIQQNQVAQKCKDFLANVPSIDDATAFMVKLSENEVGIEGTSTIYTSHGTKKIMLEKPSMFFQEAQQVILQHIKDQQVIFTALGFQPYSALMDPPASVPSLKPDYRLDWVQCLKNLYQITNTVDSFRKADTVLHAKLWFKIQQVEQSILKQQLLILGPIINSKLEEIEHAMDSIVTEAKIEERRRSNVQEQAQKAAAAARRQILYQKCARAWMDASLDHENILWANEDKILDHMLLPQYLAKYKQVGCNTDRLIKSGWSKVPRDDHIFAPYRDQPGFSSVCDELDALVEEREHVFEWHHAFFEAQDFNPRWSNTREGYTIMAWSVRNDWDQGVWYTKSWSKAEWMRGGLFVGQDEMNLIVGRTPTKGYRMSIKLWWCPRDKLWRGQ